MLKVGKIFLLCLLLINHSALAIDIIRANLGSVPNDVRTQYKMAVLRKALEVTIEKYGSYKIVTTAQLTKNNRAIAEIHSGKNTNVYMALTTKKWEAATTPIRIPIRRGILNYRLLLIHRDNAELFAKVKNLADLKKLKMGLQQSWASVEVMKANQLNVGAYNSYNGLFYQVATKRIDYFPRGINEIYNEFNIYNAKFKSLMIEPTLALYVPSATYIFVSPNTPHIAQRLTDGLTMMVENNSLTELFNHFYADNIARANLANRTIIKLDNPLLPELTPVHDKTLWWQPNINE